MILKSLRTYFTNSLLDYYPENEVDSFFNLLSEKILKMKRVDISQNLYVVVSGKKYDKFQASINRLKIYEPIQYILGDTEFYGSIFKVNSSVLIPRPETEELVEWIIKSNSEQIEKSELTILDIGTGSGCIAITLAKQLPNAKVFALDVSADALKLAQKNAEANEVTLEFIEANILDTDNVLQSLSEHITKFDIIVSNPPYVRQSERELMKANVLNHEPHLALFVEDEDPLQFYRAIADLCSTILKPNGNLYFEINENLGEITTELLTSNFTNIELKKDINEKDRMVKAIRL